MAGSSLCWGSLRCGPTSKIASIQLPVCPDANRTASALAPSTTWLLVTIWPAHPSPNRCRSRRQPPARQAAGMYCRRPGPPLAPLTARPAGIPQWSISRNRRANRATRPSAGSYGVTLPAPIMVGTSADLQVSQAVFAIGNPFGLDQTLTTGLASGRRCVATARVSHAPININPPGAGRSLGTRQQRRNEQCSLKLLTWYNEYSISYRPTKIAQQC